MSVHAAIRAAQRFAAAGIPLGIALWLVGMALPSWYVAVTGLLTTIGAAVVISGGASQGA